LTYAFNGFGKFILSKDNYNTFEIQASTQIFQNVQDNSISATLFDSFAMTTNNSQIFEIRLNSATPNNPFLEIYVNKATQAIASLSQYQAYSQQFACKSSTNNCTSIIQNQDQSVQIFFDNGEFHWQLINFKKLLLLNKKILFLFIKNEKD
jgi:hypothetical protein